MRGKLHFKRTAFFTSFLLLLFSIFIYSAYAYEENISFAICPGGCSQPNGVWRNCSESVVLNLKPYFKEVYLTGVVVDDYGDLAVNGTIIHSHYHPAQDCPSPESLIEPNLDITSYVHSGANDIYGSVSDCFGCMWIGAYFKVIYWDCDTDNDGHYIDDPIVCPVSITPKDDCNDNDPAVYLGAMEWCDAKDNDCDGQIDDNCSEPANSCPLLRETR